MIHYKRGAALLQVLIITAILGGLCAMIARSVLSRQVTSKRVRRTILAQNAIKSCMAEVNAMWALKNPDQYADDLGSCNKIVPSWSGSSIKSCDNQAPQTNEWYCRIKPTGGEEYCVTAAISLTSDSEQEQGAPKCKITYTLHNAGGL